MGDTPVFTTATQPIIVTTAETVTVTESATPVETTPSFSMTTTPKEDSTTPEMCPCVEQPSCPPAGNRILIDSLPNLQIVLPEAYLESLNREALDLDSDSVVYIRPSQIVIGKAGVAPIWTEDGPQDISMEPIMIKRVAPSSSSSGFTMDQEPRGNESVVTAHPESNDDKSEPIAFHRVPSSSGFSIGHDAQAVDSIDADKPEPKAFHRVPSSSGFSIGHGAQAVDSIDAEVPAADAITDSSQTEAEKESDINEVLIPAVAVGSVAIVGAIGIGTMFALKKTAAKTDPLEITDITDEIDGSFDTQVFL